MIKHKINKLLETFEQGPRLTGSNKFLNVEADALKASEDKAQKDLAFLVSVAKDLKKKNVTKISYPALMTMIKKDYSVSDERIRRFSDYAIGRLFKHFAGITVSLF